MFDDKFNLVATSAKTEWETLKDREKLVNLDGRLKIKISIGASVWMYMYIHSLAHSFRQRSQHNIAERTQEN